LINFDGDWHGLTDALEDAAHDWLHSQEGAEYIEDEDVAEWGVDYANVLQDCPQSYLLRHGVDVITSDVHMLDADVDLMPHDLREDGAG
jgi:hypothetical protein